MKPDRALVLLSGGIDSAVISIIAAERHAYLHFLTFDYRQANRREIGCARTIAGALKRRGPHTLLSLDMSLSARSGQSSLLSPRANTRKPNYGYYVPGRNMIFLAHAAAIAESGGIGTIYIGSNLQDAAGTPLQGLNGQPAAGYPDSGKVFLRLAESALNQGLKYAPHLSIEAPLLGMNKFDAIRYGHNRRFDFRTTWSCYTNGPRACGACPACRARILNFHWAGVVDPAAYPVPYGTALAAALDLRGRGYDVANPSRTRARTDSASKRSFGSGTAGALVKVATGLPDASEADVLAAMMRAYAQAPARVRVAPFAADARASDVQRLPSKAPSRKNDEIDRLWHICNVSADSYNYWKRLGAARRRRGV